jgi:SAM-dependent methyltransferase
MGDIEEGTLSDDSGHSYKIKGGIPRFVDGEDDIASHWGEQWNRFRRTQMDKFNGTTVSRDRLFKWTGWTRDTVRGQRILEVGCGAGRFTQVLLDAGAEVYAFDYSSSVNAALANNDHHPNLFVAQADLYRMPFRESFFDKVLCYGVLQYTPDPKRAFMSLIPFCKPGGRIAVDIYRKTRWTQRWTSKYWWRPITKRMPRHLLFQFVNWYIPRWIGWDNYLQRVPVLRRVVPAVIPCWNYRGIMPLNTEQLTEWAILDTFSSLAPWYDEPATIPVVQSWFEEAGLRDIEVKPGSNGIVGNSTKA